MKISGVQIILLMVMMSIYGGALAQDNIVKIWTNAIPGEIISSSYNEEVSEEQRIFKVTYPTLSVFKPSKEDSVNTAVIVCPGGGYARLAFDHEGYKVAKWLNKLGVTAFILKYRLPSDVIMNNKSIGPLQDVQEAMRIVRRNSQKWNINPSTIGIIGFSAGGHLAATLSTHYNEQVYTPVDTVSARPDFAILVYPVISMDSKITHIGSKEKLLGKSPKEDLVKHFSNELKVTKDTPPTFLVHAVDDKSVPVENSINYLLSLKKNAVPVELHLYQKGGHGFGMNPSENTESTWINACEIWLRTNNFL